MAEEKKSWFTHPSKTNLIVFLGVWLLGIVFSVLAWTNFFTEEMKPDTISILSLFMSTFLALKIYTNYRKNLKRGAIK